MIFKADNKPNVIALNMQRWKMSYAFFIRDLE